MILVNDLGDGYPTFPEFQVMLREYEWDSHAPRAATRPLAPMDWATESLSFVSEDDATWLNPHGGYDHQCPMCGKVYTTFLPTGSAPGHFCHMTDGAGA